MDPSAVTLYVLSLLALALGPLVYGAARVAGHMLAALDGFAFVAIAGLVVLHILPESVALAGWPAVASVAVGIWLPTLIEHRLGSLAHRVHTITLVFALLAVAGHAFLDGLVLSSDVARSGHAHMLPMAVVVHRLPVGLTVWFLLRPVYGLRLATGILALMAGATTAGFLSGGIVVVAVESRVWGLLQALVAGSLLHVVLHRSYPVAPGTVLPSVRRWQSGLGAVAGLALLGVTAAGHDLGPAVSAGTTTFFALARQSAPALLLAYVAAGLVYAFLPHGTATWTGRGPGFSQALRGMAFGLPLALGSRGVVPRYRSLVVAGVPATAALAFLVATPQLGLDAFFISLPLLGGSFTAVRVAAAAAVALLTGWLVGRVATTLPVVGGQAALAADTSIQPWAARLRLGLRRGLGEVVDATAPWILAGLALAAVDQSLVGTAWRGLVPAALEVEFFALLGMPIYVCASGATPLVAVLIHNGVSPGAALAFLLTGPVTNLTTVGVLTRLHGRRAALYFAAAVVLLSLGLGHLLNASPGLMGRVPDLAVGEDGSLWSDISLVALAVLFLQSLVRQGPRAFVGERFEAAHGSHLEFEDDCGSCHHRADDHRPGAVVPGAVAAVEEG